MTANGLSEFQETLYGCRFCPMCKPAGEVANLTQCESHTTRARAMLLWRILKGMIGWTPRGVELLYQSTLDSISEAWCVSHYPVSAYMLAARAEVYAAGLAPEAAQRALETRGVPVMPGKADVLLLAAEIAALADESEQAASLRALERLGLRAEVASLPCGALAYSLGAVDVAREQAARAADAIRASGARTVIADGPQTLWALRRVHPALGVALPGGVAAISLAEYLAAALERGELSPPRHAGKKVFVHDSRSAALLADTLAQAEAIQPGYNGDEANLGTGAVYEAPRRLVDAMGMVRLYSVWSRALSKTSGADDGLSHTYPALAEGLARQRLAEAKRIGAEWLITDSPLSAAHLARFAAQADIEVHWLPVLIAGDGA